MGKSVKVIDCNGNVLNDTYTKRARQLVKNERAVWVSDETIRLAVEHYKEEKMDNTKEINNQAPAQSTSNKVADTGGESLSTTNQAPTQSTSSESSESSETESVKLALEKMALQNHLLKEEMILQNAKNRLAMKNSLIWQTVDLVPIYVVYFAIVHAIKWNYIPYFPFELRMLILFLSFAYTIRLLFKWLKFYNVSFKKIRMVGIKSSIKRYKENQLKAECDRLRKLDTLQTESVPEESQKTNT